MALRPLLRKVSVAITSTLSTFSKSRSKQAASLQTNTSKGKEINNVLTWGSGGQRRYQHPNSLPTVTTVFSEWNVDVENMTVRPVQQPMGNFVSCEATQIHWHGSTKGPSCARIDHGSEMGTPTWLPPTAVGDEHIDWYPIEAPTRIDPIVGSGYR
jgi:hypothetical protein